MPKHILDFTNKTRLKITLAIIVIIAIYALLIAASLLIEST